MAEPIAQVAEGVSARCPRCGYDQRGVVATWTESCPLTGLCTECGVQFVWAELLAPEKFEPLWCVEFVPRWRRYPLACWTTLRRSLNPWRFWQRMRMAFQVRWLRLALYALLVIIVPPMLVHVPLQTYLAIRARHITEKNLPVWAPVAPSIPNLIVNLQSQLAMVQTVDNFVGEFSREEVIESLQAEIDRLKAMQPASSANQSTPLPAIEGALGLAIAEAIVLPWSGRSFCAIVQGGQRIMPYPAPASLRYLVWPGQTRFDSMNQMMLHQWGSLTCAWMLLFALPASFVLLPASRRRAKVRWRHIGRITFYSMAIPSMWHFLALILWNVLFLVRAPSMFWIWDNFALALWVLLPVYWAVAIRRYLLMPHAGWVATILTFMIALLMSPCLINVLPPGLVRMVMG